VIYDPDADLPIYAAISAANVNDITPAQTMPIEAGATYVFDLGYYDYRWWAKLDAAGCRTSPVSRRTPRSRWSRNCACPRPAPCFRTASAQQIADLYKRRWAIELFFRWIKQTLKIGHFLGTSKNAVAIQIAAALIAFLLLRLAQVTQTAVETQLAFTRLVRANLMHRRRLDRLIELPTQPQPLTQQMAIQWT
jgi:hypothetical protein